VENRWRICHNSASMKAMCLEKKAGAESLAKGEIQRPYPTAGEVLVKPQ